MTLNELSAKLGVSQSHLGRIERGQRFPLARILQKIAKNLGFKENELFMLAGYLSSQPQAEVENCENFYRNRGLDPYVARVWLNKSLDCAVQL